MTMTIARKLLGGSSANILLILLLAGLSLWTVGQMRTMQDTGADSFRDAIKATEAASIGAELYEVIADAEINHQLDQTAKDWPDRKVLAEKTLGEVEQAIKAGAGDPEHQQAMADAAAALADGKAAYAKLVDIFENQMLPALKANKELTQDIRDLDSKIDD